MNAPFEPTTYMRAPESARYIRVGDRTFARWKAQGKIPFVRGGRKLCIFKKADLDKLMEKMTVGAVR